MNSRDSRANRLAALVIFFFFLNPLRTTICLNSSPSSSVTPPAHHSAPLSWTLLPCFIKEWGKEEKNILMKNLFLGRWGAGWGVNIRTALSHFQFRSTIRSIYPRSPLQGQTTKQLITARVMRLPLPASSRTSK